MKRIDDPIVREVRRVREKLAAKFNYDLRAMFADVQKRQAGNPNLVTRKSRRTPRARRKAS
jgi:hypothetical protein